MCSNTTALFSPERPQLHDPENEQEKRDDKTILFTTHLFYHKHVETGENISQAA